MQPINKASGINFSEQFLAELAGRTFLNLWAYPNVYSRRAKELCDLLVVCGDYVLIFSVKNIQWRKHKPVSEEWVHWYKRAITESIKQLRGAERWLSKFPDRLYLDAACREQFPIPLPPPESAKVHRIIVALGAHNACSDYFDGDSGSFMIRPETTGKMHEDPTDKTFSPFVVGDIDPFEPFVHVFNELTLAVLMQELDTVRDFAEYLEDKSRFVRSGHLISAAGEEDLMAYYLTHATDPDRHDFTHPDNRAWQPNEAMAIGPETYTSLVKNPQYQRKKEANRNSYIWDRLIEAFTDNIIAGTTLVPEGEVFDMSTHGQAVKHMAYENRIERRLLGDGVLGVLEASHLHDKSTRIMFPSEARPRNRTGYVFMTLALPKKELEGGYEQYRRVRSEMLSVYCLSLIQQHKHIDRFIGIACEPLPTPGGPIGSSEDLVLVPRPENWTAEDEASLEEDRKNLNILNQDVIRMRNYGVEEYPEHISAIEYEFPKFTVPRKKPCSCGSGKKYKRCHGKLEK